jgi:outer membrane protein assembly factor BamB
MRALLAVLLATPAFAADWPQFRGPTGDGHSAAKSPVTTWTDTENVVWKAKIHDKGWSSPVVLGGQVWMTTATEEGHEMFAVCVDRATGQVTHDVKLFAVKNPPNTKTFNSFASPTPAAEGDRVYVHFGSFGTACLDATTGKEVWRRETGELPCDHFRNPASSPILWKNLLILTFDGFDHQYVAALDKDTGKTVWKEDRNIKYKEQKNGDIKKAYSTPSVFEIDGKPQLVSPSAEQTVAYDPATGKELWRVSHGGMNEASKPVLTDGLIILSSGHTGNMLAVKAGGSGELKKAESVAWQVTKAPTRPSVLATKGHLFYVNDQGVAFCVEAKTGKAKWEKRLDGAFSASPVLADGLIYFCGENGKTFVIRANPAEYEEVAVNKLPDGCRASPAILDDGVYVRTLTHLYKIGKK